MCQLKIIVIIIVGLIIVTLTPNPYPPITYVVQLCVCNRPANITGDSAKSCLKVVLLNYKSTSLVTHPVGVLIVAAVLGERCFRPLSQEDLGADVAVTGGPSPEH